jgi:nicotinamidase-related amidase
MALEPLGDRSCVVVVDVQERYRGSSDAPMERGVAELLLRARSAGLDIVHVLHDIQADNLVKGNPMLEMVAKTHAQGYGDHHCVPLPCAWPLEGEHVVMKRTFDSFFRTGLHALLRQLGVGHIFVCGLLTGVCVMSTTFSAFARGFEVTIITDATTDGDARRAELLRDVYPLVAREQRVAEALPPARPDLRLPPRQNLNVHDPIVEAGPPLDAQRPETTVLIIVNATPLYCNPLELRKLAQLADQFARAGGRVVQVHTETSRECPAAVAHELLTGQPPETQPPPPRDDAVAIRGSGILGDPDALKLPGVGQLALAGATASLHLPRTVLDGFNRGYWVLLVRDHLFDPSDHIERVQPAVASYDGQLCETVSVDDLLGMA